MMMQHAAINDDDNHDDDDDDEQEEQCHENANQYTHIYIYKICMYLYIITILQYSICILFISKYKQAMRHLITKMGPALAGSLYLYI
jgi:hypothetical protein